MPDAKKSILEQLMEEAAAVGENRARDRDTPVRLKVGDDEIEGVPLSMLGADTLAKFGLTGPGGDSGEGGDGGGSEGTGGGQGDGGTVREFFTGRSRKAAGQ